MIGLVLSVMVAAGGSSPEAEGIGKPPAGKPPAQARLMARRAAEVVAVRNLALANAGVDTSLRTAHIRWSGVVRGYRVKRVEARSDGSVRVVVTKRPAGDGTKGGSTRPRRSPSPKP